METPGKVHGEETEFLEGRGIGTHQHHPLASERPRFCPGEAIHAQGEYKPDFKTFKVGLRRWFSS